MNDKPLVLVVDDEAMVLRMLESSLKSINYDVLTADSGDAALDLIRQENVGIDIVLTDIRMPGMSGISLQREINELSPEIPVIMMTGYSDFDMVVDALRQHTFDLVFKPLEIEQIEWCLNKATQFIKHRNMEKNYLATLEIQVAEQTATLRRQLQEIEEARAIAATVDELKREFLSIVSHELRTPLNGIKGIVQLLEDDPSEESLITFVPLLKESTEKLHGLVENILTLSRVKSLDIHQRMDINSLSDAITPIIERTKRKAAERKLSFSATVGGLSNKQLRGPWEAIQIILSIFLDNAMKFTDPGGTTSCSITADPVSGSIDEVMLSIKVSDSGIGIQADLLKEIFKPFVQLENFLTRRYSGAGIGLAIAEGLSEKLGGEISAESKPGMGSTFCCAFKFRS